MNADHMLRARLVLADCKIAADQLDRTTDEEHWRVPYVACLALLRSTGHVLAKVDAGTGDNEKREIAAFWAELKANKDQYLIFWNFIERERNRILKEYVFASSGFSDVPLIIYEDANDPDSEVSEIDFTDGLMVESESQIEYDFEDQTPFLGHDLRDLVREGIDFWEKSLSSIEKKLAGSDGSDA
jgi:hypothetical protein